MLFCQHEMESQYDNSNPHDDSDDYFGYTEKFGNHDGQGEYVTACVYCKAPFKMKRLSVLKKAVNLKGSSLFSCYLND
ncbi:uncharacterized zinc-type alcohol dehydrogenase-like protein YbdR [Bacillus sp. JCM 19047]|nr:uncharacterized zinc-type alcohol dehydrogenase-like protein YbdR [Bacillus sp. JCM 19047]